MNAKNKYGYRLCYKENELSKLKTQMITLSFELVIWEIDWYRTHRFYDIRDNHYIPNPLWYINEVKTLKQYDRLWKGCPFKDDLS